MATTRLMAESEATGRVKEIFDEIKSTLSLPFVPELFRALGYQEKQLDSVWGKVTGLLAGGTLDVKTKLLAALAVATVQNSSYFVTTHTMALKRLGATEAEVKELLEVVSLVVSLNTLASDLNLESEF